MVDFSSPDDMWMDTDWIDEALEDALSWAEQYQEDPLWLDFNDMDDDDEYLRDEYDDEWGEE